MSVTFNRIQLIKVAKLALAEHDKAKAVRAQAVAKYKANHAAENTKRTREHAIALRDGLTKALKRPGPITAQTAIDALGGNYMRDRLYSEPGNYDVDKHVTVPTGLLKPAEVSETRALISVLEAATGDVITANELKLLGLKNLQPVFVAAASDITGNTSKK